MKTNKTKSPVSNPHPQNFMRPLPAPDDRRFGRVIPTAHDFVGHADVSALGYEFGVTWKGRNYTLENGELSRIIVRALMDIGTVEPSLPRAELVRLAFWLARQRGDGNTPCASTFLASVRENEKRRRVAHVRQSLVDRERREINEKLKSFRQQNEFRLYSCKKARSLGWLVDDIQAVSELDGTLSCRPWEMDGKRLTKVFGFTMFFHGQFGDDPPDEDMFDGDHEAGSLFVSQKDDDPRDPHELFEQHQTMRRDMEAEIAG